MSEEKTEKPTGQRLRQARKDGQVARTPELGAWFTVLVLSVMLPKLVSKEFNWMREFMISTFKFEPNLGAAEAQELIKPAFMHFLTVSIVLGVCVMVVGVVFALAQGGFFLATGLMKPSLKKFNPVSGIKQMFGPHSLWEGAKALIKTVIVGLVVWRSVSAIMPIISGLVPFDMVLEIGGGQAISLIRNIAIAGVIMGVADYAMARRRTNKAVKMTKEEVKQEFKNSEGDPHVKGKRKSIQMSMARARMFADVPQADAVLVNPTHVAVAIKYDALKGSPTVIAAGADVIALRIKEIANEHRVPIIQDVPLARALYKSTKVGQHIPPELFAAVATVLAFVISQKSKGSFSGEHRSPRRDEPLPEVPRVRRRKPRTPPAGEPAPKPSRPVTADR